LITDLVPERVSRAFGWLRGKGHEKRGSGAGTRFQPDPSAVALDHPAHQDEPDAFALCRVGVKPVERGEDPILIGQRNAEAVVLHIINPEVGQAVSLVRRDTPHVDPAGSGRVKVTDGVVKQISEDLLDRSGVAPGGWEEMDVYL